MGRNDARMSLTLPDGLKDEFVAIAEKNQRSLTQELIIAIQEHIDREKSDKDEYCLPNGESLVTKENLIEALRELKKEGFSFENL